MVAEIFKKTGLYLIAGVNGVGRTSLVSSLIEDYREVVEQKYSLYCYTNENTGRLPDKSDRLKIIEVSELPIHTGHIFLEAKWTKDDHGLSAVFVDDYRFLLRTESFRAIEPSREEKLMYLLSRLKTLSEVYDVPVIITGNVDDDYVLSRWDKKPQVSDVLDTEWVKEFVDEIVLMYRDEMFNPDSKKKGITELRTVDFHCETVRDYQIVYIPERGRYFDIGTISSVEEKSPI